MKENIMPSYLPAAAVTFTPKAGGEPVTVYRPYEAFTLAELEQHRATDAHGVLLALGERYFFGVGGAEQDYRKAYDCLRQAAELGVQDAQALLAGYYIQDDIGILQTDPAKCVEMLTLAAENGSWKAMETLAAGYRDGSGGLPIDHERAYLWAEQAERMLRIYWAFYAQPNFVDFKQTQKEILHAHTRMTLALAFFCANGVGVKRDLDAARQWLDRGEQFVCGITGLAKVPIFQEKRAELNAREKKAAARAEQAAKDAKKKKRK